MPVTATGQETDSAESFGKFAVFAGVAKVPTRVKCAHWPGKPASVFGRRASGFYGIDFVEATV